MELGLGGKRVLVAGASRGLGFAVVSQLLSEGAEVLAVSRDEEDLALAREEWFALFPAAKIDATSVDLSSKDAAKLLRAAVGLDTRLDGLIVVAGNGRPIAASATRAFEIAAARNLFPTISAVEACAPQLGNSADGAVVVVSSIAGIEFVNCPVEYAASKAALIAYSAHLARALKPTRVNTVAPGNMLTDASIWAERLKTDTDALNRHLSDTVVLGRLGNPEEVARVCTFMVSPASSFMTGSTVVVDGGQIAEW